MSLTLGDMADIELLGISVTVLFCNSQDIEGKHHFMVICLFLEEIRKKYVQKYKYQRQSMFKFLKILGIDNKTKLNKISLFIIYALNKRNSFLIVKFILVKQRHILKIVELTQNV